MSELVRHTEGLWTAFAPHRYFGLQLGTRMTAIRLPDGALWLHSVVAIDDLLADEIQALGPVRHIVVPDLYHHVYVVDAVQRWPAARVYAPTAMRRKRPELRIDAELTETPDSARTSTRPSSSMDRAARSSPRIWWRTSTPVRIS